MADRREEAMDETRQHIPKPEVEAEETRDTKLKAEPAAEEPKAKEGPKFLDLAFAMDCTGSMGSYISSAQQGIRDIVEQVVSAEKADVKLALVEYRDHPPQDSSFVTRVHDFTGSVRNMKQWLNGCQASGGGDQAEAVADALLQIFKLDWRQESTKVCVLISDAPPHGLGCSGDGFPNGCPDNIDPMEVTNMLANKGVTIYVVGCEPSITPFKEFFMALCHLTGGQYIPLASAHLLSKVITGGVQEQISLQQLMDEVNQEVRQEFAATEGEIDEDALTRKLHAKMRSKGTQAKQLHRNNAQLQEASPQAQQMSNALNMKAVRDLHVTSNERFGRSAAPAPTGPPSSSPGFFGRLFGAVTGGSAAPPPPPPSSGGAPAPPPPASSFASASDTYDCVEDDISEAQVQRLCQQSVWQNDLKGRYKKKF